MTIAAALLAASTLFGLPPGLLSAVCYVESGHNAKVIHLDDGGHDSIGLCQVQVRTARHLGYKGPPSGLLSPKTNAHYAAKYLSYQIKRYGGDLRKAVSAYNSGTYIENKKKQPVNKKYVDLVFEKWHNAPKKRKKKVYAKTKSSTGRPKADTFTYPSQVPQETACRNRGLQSPF